MLVASLMLFSGCGGGGNDTPLDTTSNTQNSSAIEQSLRNAGYRNVSDIVELGTNTIAFTYFNNDNKHFVIYNNKEGKILSDIPQFTGSTVTSSTSSSVTFDNNTKISINTNDYTQKPVVTTQPSVLDTETIIKNRLSADGMVLLKYNYSLQSEGILAIGRNRGGGFNAYRFNANPALS
jgi:hypothetical protein